MLSKRILLILFILTILALASITLTRAAILFPDSPSASPNLIPQPPTGWSAPVVPTFITGTNTIDTLYAGLGVATYFDVAVLNDSDSSIATPSTTCLYIDGSLVQSWTIPNSAPNTFQTIEDFAYVVPAPGTYTVALEADCITDQIAESNETDNLWSATFTWKPYNGVLLSDEQAFDKCNVASTGDMNIWWNESPYQETNIYIGGIARFCDNTELTASWVKNVVEQGWNLIPTWVGPQAPCSAFNNRFSWNPGTAREQGRREADAAYQTAKTLGLIPPGSQTILYYDLEAFPNHPLCREAAGELLAGWTARLHELGQVSGVYGAGCGSYPTDWPNLSSPPDAVWLAHWIYSGYNASATVWDVACVPNTLWDNFERLRQYAGGHNETHGGATFNIDSNIARGPVAGINPRTPDNVAPIEDMQLLAPGQGWIVQDGKLLWKNPGDTLWTDRTPPDQTAPDIVIAAAFFLDPNAGWVLTPAPNGDGALTLNLFATPDQGQTWQPAGTLPATYPDGIGGIWLQFIDSQTGWAAVQRPSSSNFSLGQLFRTQDGGQTWEELPLPIGGAIEFVDTQTGWTAGGANGDELYVTHDGGESWLGMELVPGPAWYGLPTFVNGTGGMQGILPVTLPAAHVAFFTSKDNGQTWQPAAEIAVSTTYSPSTPFPTSIVDANTWIIANPETGALLLTQDAGQTVSTYEVSLPGVQTIQFTSADFGWALTFSVTCTGTKETPDFQCSAQSGLERSINGGQTWTPIIP